MWMRNKLKAYEWELRDRIIRVTPLRVFTTGCLIRRRKLMRPPADSWKKPCDHRHLFSWGIQFYVCYICWKSTHRPGGSCKALMMTLWSEVVEEPLGRDVLLGSLNRSRLLFEPNACHVKNTVLLYNKCRVILWDFILHPYIT